MDAIERKNVSLVGYHDLDDRPGLKMGLQAVDERLYLYLAHVWHSGWSILDVTDPADPELVDFVEGPENTRTIQMQVADGKMITSLESPLEGWGPIGESMDPSEPFEEGVYVWDVETDPTSPELLGEYHTGGEGTHRNHYDGGDYVYLASKPAEFEGAMLEILDISTPSEPEVASRWWWPGQGPDDEEDATESAYFHGPAYPVGDRLYLSYGRIGMVVLDVSDVTDPEFLTRVQFGDLGSMLGTHSAVPLPDTDLVVVNDEAMHEGSPLDDGEPLNYAYLVDVSDESLPSFDWTEYSGPTVVSSLPQPRPEPHVEYDNYHEKPGRFGPHNQHHYQYQDEHYEANDVVAMAYFNAGLRLYDVSDPLAPEEVGHYVPRDPPKRITTRRPASGLVSYVDDVLVDSRGYIYCTDPNQGLFVLESDVL